jgi:hypothetical protein
MIPKIVIFLWYLEYKGNGKDGDIFEIVISGVHSKYKRVFGTYISNIKQAMISYKINQRILEIMVLE